MSKLKKDYVVGIGITTRNRPAHLAVVLKQISKYWKTNQKIIIVDDASDGGEEKNVGIVATCVSEAILTYDAIMYFCCPQRIGIAKAKNKCLLELKELYNCDFFILLDDDAFPIKDGWCEMFIQARQISRQQHFLYLKPQGIVKKVSGITHTEQEGSQLDNLPVTRIDIDVYDNCQGCIMFMTKKVIEVVGGFNPNYGIYGYEHASYSQRVRLSKLNSYGNYLTPSNAGEYVYAMDLDQHLTKELHLKLLYKDEKCISSLASEMDKVPGYLKENIITYRNDKQIYQPLE